MVKNNIYKYAKKYVGVFIDDKIHGENIKEYYSNNQVYFSGSKNIGVKNGKCQSYWKNGNLISDKFFARPENGPQQA